MSAFVFNNDFRHPAVLAQDLASLDVLSDGRLDIGIGAGWRKVEYDGIGMTFDPVPVRSARLAEAVTVLKGLFADETLTYAAATTGSRSWTACRSRCSGHIRRS